MPYHRPFRAAFVLLFGAWLHRVYAYTSGVPRIDRRAIAGLWKLTPGVASLKEFTVHPKKEEKNKDEEMLLMLKEDGSFQRYVVDQEQEEDNVNANMGRDVDESWKQFMQDGKALKHDKDLTKKLFKGTWDYRDGKLTLAADRDDHTNPKTKSDHPKDHNVFYKKEKDTILVGALVLTTQRQPPTSNSKIRQEEILERANSTDPESVAASTTASIQQLSVPMGSVQVGKFMYPKTHPSFFDQPIFQPKPLQNFQLKQVLKNNADALQERKEDQLIEKFRNKDFYNKTFFLTSSPIPPSRPKGRSRWSIKYNKFVEDPPSRKAKEEADAQEKRPINIRVMKVTIHPNNTFSTVAGLGDDTILRGRFSVIGEQRDQLWMQVIRFGFGRSVSGSIYSEGVGLSHEDAKSYWGKISYEEEETEVDSRYRTVKSLSSSSSNDDSDGLAKKRLQVHGTVIYGYSLEPQPIARFLMTEADDDGIDHSEMMDDEEEDENEDGDDSGHIDPWAGAFQ